VPHGIDTGLIDRITPLARELVTSYARSLPHLRYADIRIDVTEAKRASAENGSPRSSGDDYGFSFGVRVLAGDRMVARISARKVYEIRDGRLGRLYRDGGIMADSRDYLMKVDAVGTDFQIHPIPNCGKGQPMQSKKLGNGGPTMRSRAILTGGRE
jgi:predicted Zn-dependent protease